MKGRLRGELEHESEPQTNTCECKAKEVGIDISGNKPEAITMDVVEKAERMIMMGCGAEAEAACPASFIETEDWSLEDPKSKSLEQVRKIRDEIKERELLDC